MAMMDETASFGSYIVPIKALKKTHKLPPQKFFQKVQGVRMFRLKVKVEPNRLKVFTTKTWEFAHVFFVVRNGYIFVYPDQEKERGYALKVEDAKEIAEYNQVKNGTEFRSRISFPFKHGVIHFYFDNIEEYEAWSECLRAILHPDEYRMRGRKDEIVTAERTTHPEKTNEEWVQIRRCPANLLPHETIIYDKTILEDDDNEEDAGEMPSSYSAFAPRSSSTRMDEEFDLEEFDDEAGDDQVFEEESEHSTNRTPSYRNRQEQQQSRSSSLSRFGRKPLSRSVSRTPSTRSQSRGPGARFGSGHLEDFGQNDIDYGQPTPPALESISLILSQVTPRKVATEETFDYGHNISTASMRSRAAAEVQQPMPPHTVQNRQQRNPSVSRARRAAEEVQRRQERSLFVSRRLPATNFSYDDDIQVSTMPPPTPRVVQNRQQRNSSVSRARRAAAVEEDESTLSVLDPNDRTYQPSSIDSQSSRLTVQSLRARPPFKAPEEPRRSGRTSKPVKPYWEQ